MEEGGALAQLLIDAKVKEIRSLSAIYQPGQNIFPLLVEQASSTQFSLDLSRRMRDATRSTAEAGGWPRAAPVGYLNYRKSDNLRKGAITTDPVRGPLIQRMFELMASRCYSVRELVDKANNEWGLTLRATSERPERSVPYHTGYQILTNPFYAGFVKHNGVQYQGSHTPLVSVSLFDQVQEVLHRFYTTRRCKHSFTYTGLMTCGFCGQQVTAEQHYKGGRRHVYYRCCDTYQRCTKRSITEENLEQKILDMLVETRIDPIIGAHVLEELLRWEARLTRTARVVADQQERQLEAIEKKRKNLLDMLISGTITDQELYRAKESELLSQRNQLQLAHAHEKDNSGNKVDSLRAGMNFLQTAKECFVSAAPKSKMRIARTLASAFILRGNELEIVIDPFIQELSDYAHEFQSTFEPTVEGSVSQLSEAFFPSFHFGVSEDQLVDPPRSLIEALRSSAFRYSPLTDEEDE